MIRRGEIVAALALSPQGQTLPFTCLARLEDGEVVKCLAKCSSKRTGYGPPEIIRELVGTRAAQLLDLQCAEPFLLRLPPGKENSLLEQWGLEPAGDFAFSSRFFAALDVLQPNYTPGLVLPWDAANVFALDLVTLNSDRSRLNPNLGFLDDRIAVFDFEHILPSGVQSPDRLEALWTLSVEDLLEGHPLGDRASAKKVAQSAPLAVAALSVAQREVMEACPLEWAPLFEDLTWILAYTQLNMSSLQSLVLEGER